MFERFTDRARRVVVLAQEEARSLDHNYIGTEHLLLGLIHEEEGVAAKALTSTGVSLEAARRRVVDVVGQGTDAPSGHIPFTPRAKKVLELSLREALQMGHNYIGTEHLLLGLLHEKEGVGARVLSDLGADLGSVRAAVLALLGNVQQPRVTTDPLSLEVVVAQLVAELGPELQSLIPGDEAMGRAIELAIEAVVRRPDGVVMRLLADLESAQEGDALSRLRDRVDDREDEDQA